MAKGSPEGGAAGALVLHTERSDKGPSETPFHDPSPMACERPRRGMHWQHEDGSLSPVRCGSPNLCRYCSWLTALENAYVVRLDAEMCCPRIGFTLTTKAAVTPPATFRNDVAYVFKTLRREPWACEARYLGQIEFTTGQGRRSGGARRIHQHGLLKDVDPARAADCGELMKRVWSRVTGAHRVEAHELLRPAGAMAYLVNHHQKEAQTPPRGWSGKRLRPSKGYYEIPAPELRERARAALADKRVRAAVEKSLSSHEAWESLDGQEQADAFASVLDVAMHYPSPVLVRTAALPVDFDVDADGHMSPTKWERTVLGPLHEDDAA